jgi:polyisoprenoid-binding protein YceI
MSVADTTTISKTIAPAGTWSADPVHSHVSFEVVYSGVNEFRGSFSDFQATLAGGEEPTLEGNAKVASVDVKDEQLNGHLQTPDFFDAARFPEIAFKATELRKTGDNAVEAKGELTIKGVTQPITLTGKVAEAPATDPFGRERLGLRLESEIDRTQYGVSWNAPNQSGGDYLANNVKLIAELALVKQEG